MLLAYEEFVDFIAAGSTPQAVIDFQPSAETKAYVAELLQRQQSPGLTADETTELQQFLQVEHIMRLAKAKARQRLGQS